MSRGSLLIALVGAAIGAPTASAATVEVGDAFPGGDMNPAVLITDETGEVNSLTITYEYTAQPLPGDGTVTVRDQSAPLQAGDGCVAAGDGVRCEVEDLFEVRAMLGAGDDTAAVESPPSRSCGCVSLRGGDGNDELISRDGAELQGDAGNDHLIGEPNTALRPIGRNAGHASGEYMTGGAGNDTLEGGAGPDSMHGGSSSLQEPVPAGRDRLNGGDGDDSLDDGDDHGGEIGPDLLIGGSDEDEVYSYLGRSVGVRVDLSKNRGDGQPGEADEHVNVEVLYGSSGDDRFVGDGDANTFYPSAGNNRVRGRGGNDYVFAMAAEGRNAISGDLGRDTIRIEAYASASIRCGRGRDVVIEEPRGPLAPRQVDAERDRGPWISGSCEELQSLASVDPVPDGRVKGRRLTFDLPSGARFRRGFRLDLSGVGRPFDVIASGRLKRRGVTLKLPRNVARRARRHGFQFRAELWNERAPTGARLRVLWRFRQQP